MASSIAATLTSCAKVYRNSSLSESSFLGVPITPPSFNLKAKSSSPCNASFSMSAAPPQYDLNNFRFEPIKASIVSCDMTRRYMMDMITHADTDVVVVGAVFAGLSYAYELGKNPSVQVAIIEQSVSPRGVAWLGVDSFSPPS